MALYDKIQLIQAQSSNPQREFGDKEVEATATRIVNNLDKVLSAYGVQHDDGRDGEIRRSLVNSIGNLVSVNVPTDHVRLETALSALADIKRVLTLYHTEREKLDHKVIEFTGYQVSEDGEVTGTARSEEGEKLKSMTISVHGMLDSIVEVFAYVQDPESEEKGAGFASGPWLQ